MRKEQICVYKNRELQLKRFWIKFKRFIGCVYFAPTSRLYPKKL